MAIADFGIFNPAFFAPLLNPFFYLVVVRTMPKLIAQLPERVHCRSGYIQRLGNLSFGSEDGGIPEVMMTEPSSSRLAKRR